MTRDKFGYLTHTHGDSHAPGFERAPRVASSDWSLTELNPLTQSLLISSAYLIGAVAAETGRQSFDEFAETFAAVFPRASVDEARSALERGQSVGLQRFVLGTADVHYPALQVVDSAEAIADIPRSPSTTDAAFREFKNEYLLERFDTACPPLHDLSLLAIASLKPSEL